jgi:Tfp pilus assembly protein PilO
MELLLHPVTVTILLAAGLLALQVWGQIAIANLTPEDAKKWPAIGVAATTVLLQAVVVVPTINNLWSERRDQQNEERAQQREIERQQREVRDTHLELANGMFLLSERRRGLKR